MHARATAHELETYFSRSDGGLDHPDHPDHWFEAQLMHHGLPRSTHAGLNKLRLHLAVTSGTCSVPPSILDIEADLREKHMVNYGEDMEVYTEDHGPKKDHESDRPCLDNIDRCSSLSAQDGDRSRTRTGVLSRVRNLFSRLSRAGRKAAWGMVPFRRVKHGGSGDAGSGADEAGGGNEDARSAVPGNDVVPSIRIWPPETTGKGFSAVTRAGRR